MNNRNSIFKKFLIFSWASVLIIAVSVDKSRAQSTTAQTQGRGLGLQPPKPLTELPSTDKRWALVIGVDKYKDGQIGSLKGSANDAHMLAEALVHYAGFPRDQVILMSTDQPDERQPTRVNILRRLSNLASVVPKNGLLLISFAGHGMERGGQAYLLPSDAQITDDVTFLEETAISVTRVKERIKATGVGQVLVLLDACRNDPGGRADAPNPLTQAYTKGFNFDVRNREVQAFATFYATAVGQRAYEYTEKKQGYFTWALVEGLKGGAANEKGEVTLSALVKYVQETVPKRIGIDLGAGKQQRPFAVIEGYRAEELVVAVGGTSASTTSTSSGSVAADPAAVELSYWESIKNSTDPEDFKSYLEKFPDGQFADLAKRRARIANESAGLNSTANNYQQIYGELMEVEHKINEAVLKGDKATVEGFMADEFKLNQDGKTYTKTQYLAQVKPMKTVKEAHIEEASLSFQGDNVVLSGISLFRVKQLFMEMNIKQRFVDTYVKRQGHWLAVSSQINTIK